MVAELLANKYAVGSPIRVLEEYQGKEQRRHDKKGGGVETKNGSGWGRPARRLLVVGGYWLLAGCRKIAGKFQKGAGLILLRFYPFTTIA